MRDTRDPETIGLKIKQFRQNGLDALTAADRACPPTDRNGAASQAFVRNDFRPSPNGSPAPENPPQEGERAA